MCKPAALTAILLAVACAPSSANPGDDQWQPVVRDGFGAPGIVGVEDLEAGADRLFAATRARSGQGPASVFATADDGGTWQAVPFTPALPPSTTAISALASGSDGALFAGTTDQQHGGGLYALDGMTLTAVPGWQPRPGVAVSTGMLATPTHLYVGTTRREGGELWRVDRATGVVERVLDFAEIDPAVDAVGVIAPYRGALYAGTRRRGGAAVWTSETGGPGTWRMVTGTRRGFARRQPPGQRPNLHVGIAMSEYDGRLYVATDNPGSGGELYSTADGHRWRTEGVAGVDQPAHRALLGLQPFEGSLWLTTLTRAPDAAQVFEASAFEFDDNGSLGFGEMSVPGFGNADTRGGSPDLAVWGDSLWWAGANPRTGAQVWRLRAEDLRRATATGPGLRFVSDTARLSGSGRFTIAAQCPAEDPYGCHAAIEVSTQQRHSTDRGRKRIELDYRIVDVDAGATKNVTFRLRGDKLGFVRARLPMRLLVRSIAFDNAHNGRGTVMLTG